jgi:hypothetical protein
MNGFEDGPVGVGLRTQNINSLGSANAKCILPDSIVLLS